MTDAPLKFHPLADLFPLMEGEEFDASEKSLGVFPTAKRAVSALLIKEGGP